MFVQACPGGGRIHSCSLGSFGHALWVIGFIPVRWVRMGAPFGSSGSFGIVGLILVRPAGGPVH